MGCTIERYAEPSRQGRTYTPLPYALTRRVNLSDLADPDTRERLCLV